MRQMKNLFAVAGMFVLLISNNSVAQDLDGFYEASPRWGSGWIDLRQPTTFESGTCLNLAIGGTATKVLVRFVQVDDDPNRPVGIVGGIRDLSGSRDVSVQLKRRFPNIKQISVHGNPKAWHFDLGNKNGPATLEAISIVSCQSQ